MPNMNQYPIGRDETDIPEQVDNTNYGGEANTLAEMPTFEEKQKMEDEARAREELEATAKKEQENQASEAEPTNEETTVDQESQQSPEKIFEGMSLEDLKKFEPRTKAEADAHVAAIDKVIEVATQLKDMSLEDLAEFEPQSKFEEEILAIALKQAKPQEAVGNVNAAELSPKAAENLETAKKKSGFKKFVALALAASIAVGAVGLFMQNANPQGVPKNSGTKTEQSYEEEKNEVEKEGIKDGYGEKGMYLSENKPNKLAFGSAVEVAEMFDGDECEMVKYTANNEVEAMAAYMAHIPKELQPEGFKGLTIKQAEEKLESLSDDEYEKVQEQFNNAIDEAFTRTVDVNGTYDNVYMDYIDPSGGAVHENMEAVKCVTNEDAKMREFFWMDENGNEIGSMLVKIIVDDEGNIIDGCIQVLDEQGNPIFEGTPERPDPNPDKTGAGGKEGSGGKENAGGGKEGAGGGKEDAGGKEGSGGKEDAGGKEGSGGKEDAGGGKEGAGGKEDAGGKEGSGGKEDAGGGKEGAGGDEGGGDKPKDAENLERIDNNINNDIADDIGTDKVDVHQEQASDSDKTDKPSDESYQGTESETQQNEASKEAEPVQQNVSEENNYSEDKGGANSNEYAPVQGNETADEQADQNEVKQDEAPKAEEEAQDTLKDLGIE